MSYVIFGKRILNEYLVLGTFAAFGGGVALSMRGGDDKAAKAKQQVPITASSGEEEAFMRDFVANMEREEAKAKH